ncbi:MAG TPA: Fic family protein [Trebonia sp.]|jgi:Fic family protein
MSGTDYATFDATEPRAMHYMMLSHDLSKSPGRYRKGPIYVHDERSDKVVYEGPDAAEVPALMESLAASLQAGHSHDPVVRSAMAHLDLVMIHPFRDGNGRMARALATLVLTRSDIGEPEFSSIEEWLGGEPLLDIRRRRREERTPLRDPYPWMRVKLAEPSGQ